MSVRERIERGAALLDAKEPGWRDRISPAELDIASCSRCVIGQVFGIPESNFGFDASEVWGDKTSELGCYDAFNFNGAEDFGFCGLDPEDFDALRDEWVRFLKGEEAR